MEIKVDLVLLDDTHTWFSMSEQKPLFIQTLNSSELPTDTRKMQQRNRSDNLDIDLHNWLI